MKLTAFVIWLCLLLPGKVISQQKDTFQFPGNEHPSEFKAKNWGTYFNGILSNKVVPDISGLNFPAAVLFSDESFRQYYTNHKFYFPSFLYFKNIDFNQSNNDSVLRYSSRLSDSIFPFVSSSSDKSVDYIELGEGMSISNSYSLPALAISNIKSPAGDFQYTNNTAAIFSLSNSSFKNYIAISNQSRIMEFTDCEIGDFLIKNDSITSFDAHYLNTLKQIMPEVNAEKLDFLKYSFANTKTESITFQNIKSKNVLIDFTGSSITKEFYFSDQYLNDLSIDSFTTEEEYAKKLIEKVNTDTPQQFNSSLHLEFNNSFIDAHINSYKESRSIVVDFINCRFGENVDLGSMNFDTLSFTNCTRFQSDIYLNIPSKKQVYISIKNCDLTKIHFDYAPNVHFINNYLGDESFDEINKNYNNLLDKFRREGKENSFRNLEIEYKQWKYGQSGWWGKFLNLVDRSWWYYGYRKQYILYWSLFLLLFFAILNFRAWRNFREVYPVINSTSPAFYEKAKFKNEAFTRSLHVLVVTFFIFFSIKIEYTKLNYKNNRMLLLFFFQYVIGLICLFFIINFILKI